MNCVRVMWVVTCMLRISCCIAAYIDWLHVSHDQQVFWVAT